MDGEQIFKVTEYGDCCCEGGPSYVKIDFTRELRNKIRKLMVAAKTLKHIDGGWQVSCFDDRGDWLDLHKEIDKEIRVECVTLDVHANSFCWHGTIKNTDVKIGFGDLFFGTAKSITDFFKEGDMTETEAIESNCKDLLKLLGGSKMQKAVTLAVIGEEVRHG